MTVEVSVDAPSRLHLGLFDLGHVTARTFGGMGIMVREPRTRVEASRADLVSVDASGVSESTRRFLEHKVSQLGAHLGASGVAIRVREAPPEHVGLGSKTSLVLATLTAAASAWKRACSRDRLLALSGRGGTSGIGINGFFSGGLLVDAGHAGRVPLVPSSARVPSATPPVVLHRHLPPDWHITLVLDRREVGRSGADETKFFRESTPIPAQEVWKAVTIAYHEAIPALDAGDISAFGNALRDLSTVGFKRREIDGQSVSTRSLLSVLQEATPCAGMSSMGPLLYVISDSESSATIPHLGDEYLVWQTSGDNCGHTVTYG